MNEFFTIEMFRDETAKRMMSNVTRWVRLDDSIPFELSPRGPGARRRRFVHWGV